MTFKKSLLIALLSFGIANAALAETDTEKFDRAFQYFKQENHAAAFPLLKELAEKGVKEAQFYLGHVYYKGKAVTQNHKQAIYWYEKAAEQGYTKAQITLGATYELGIGINRDLSKAEYYYNLACDGGNQDGCKYHVELLKAEIEKFDSALQYFKQENYAAAFSLFKELAEQGYAESQYILGTMYQEGQGVTQDDRQAAYWYQKAAEQGHAKAQYKLGYAYSKGKGVTQDYKQAVYWHQKAAEQGHSYSQVALGILYESGIGTHQNVSKAKYYYGLACDDGVQDGCKYYAELDKQGVKETK